MDNIKASFKYQLFDHVKPIIIFYLVLLCIFVIFSASLINYNDSSIQFGGLDFATVIFLFITGLNSFKETFGMFIQNGTSRKTMFAGRLLTSIVVCVGMALIDNIIILFCKAGAAFGKNLEYKSMFEMIYHSTATGMSAASLFAASFIYDFLLYLGTAAAGYMITVLFYRLNKAGKIAVGVGIPVALNLVFNLDERLYGNFGISVLKFIDFAFGLSHSQPINACTTFLVSFILFGLLGWLLMRKAIVRA